MHRVLRWQVGLTPQRAAAARKSGGGVNTLDRRSSAKRDDRRRALHRQGAVTIWTILCLPVILTVLFGTIQMGRLWQARVQLENALEAAALAAVQQWGALGGGALNVAAAQSAGKTYGKANTVHGIPVDLDDGSIVPLSAWTFGTAAPNGTGYDFTPAPNAAAQFAVVLQATVRVHAILKLGFGHSTVAAKIAAYYDPSDAAHGPRLIRLN
ncbi:MAG: TadE family protein [Thermoguttaceae bacterium]|jgi:Flp pilus assembly protein TadG